MIASKTSVQIWPAVSGHSSVLLHTLCGTLWGPVVEKYYRPFVFVVSKVF